MLWELRGWLGGKGWVLILDCGDFNFAIVFYSRIGELILITHCLSAGRMCLTWWGGPQLKCGVAVGQDGGQHMAHSFTHPVEQSFLKLWLSLIVHLLVFLLVKKEGTKVDIFVWWLKEQFIVHVLYNKKKKRTASFVYKIGQVTKDYAVCML